jgi:nitrite reductase/ring-hydroxylating ferredoxin subunit
MTVLHRIVALDELWSGELTSRTVNGRPLLLIRMGDRVCAYEDRCPHQGMALSRGTLDGHTLTCCAHHWQFDVRDGAGINPANTRLRSVPVSVIAGQVVLEDSEVRDAAA